MSAPSIPAEAKADFARYRANGGTADLTTWWARYADDYGEHRAQLG